MASLCLNEIRNLARHGPGILLDRQLGEDFLQRRQRHQIAQVFNRIVRDELAAMQRITTRDDTRSTVSSSCELKRITLPARRQFLDQAAQNQTGTHIEAGERLVEQDQFGIVQQGR